MECGREDQSFARTRARAPCVRAGGNVHHLEEDALEPAVRVDLLRLVEALRLALIEEVHHAGAVVQALRVRDGKLIGRVLVGERDGDALLLGLVLEVRVDGRDRLGEAEDGGRHRLEELVRDLAVLGVGALLVGVRLRRRRVDWVRRVVVEPAVLDDPAAGRLLEHDEHAALVLLRDHDLV